MNLLDSRNDLSGFIPRDQSNLVNKAAQDMTQDTLGSSINVIVQPDERSTNARNHTVSGVLNSFLAQQDKRIDFGLCTLYQKVRDGHHFELEAPAGTKVLKADEVKNLMDYIKNKQLQTLTK